MAVLVTDGGFAPDDWAGGYVPLAAMSDTPGDAGVDLSAPDLTRHEWERLRALMPGLGLVRVRLRHFGDIAALDLARAMRQAGYTGRLRAHGAVLARFYTLARRAGFDEIELDPWQAWRQPAEHWRIEGGFRPALRVRAR